MTKPYVRDEYDEYVEPGIDCSGDPPLTQQHFKDDCDINLIVERMTRAGGYDVGGIGHVPPQFGDFSSAVDFQEAQNIIARAGEEFAALPSKVRERFQNNPLKMLEFVEDEKNTEEAIKLGIASPRPVVSPVVPPVAPVAPKV